MDGMGKSGMNLGRTLQAAVLPLAALGAAAAGFGAFAVKAASDVAESQNKVNVVFGEGAGAINAFSQTAAASLGISRGAALDAAGTFGNMFGQLGIGADVTADMSKQMITLAADLGSFHNADITEVIAAQTSAFRGEYDAVQRFVPTINAAAVAEKALEMTGKKATAELTLQEKALATHALLMAGAGAATGDFANTSTGMANSMKIIRSSFENMVVQIGEKLLPIITPLIASLAQALPGALDFASQAIDGVIGAFQAFMTATEGVRDFIGTLIDIIQDGIIPAFALLLEGDFSGFVETLQTTFSESSDILTGFGQHLLSWITEVATNIATNVVAWGKAFIEWIAPMIPPMLAELVNMAGELLSWVVAQVPGIIAQLGEWVSAFLDWVLPLIPPMLSKLGQVLSSVLDWVISNGPGILETFISEWVPAAIGWIAQAALKIAENLPEILWTIGSWIVTEGIPKVGELFLRLGAAIVTGIIKGITNAAGQLFSAIGDLIGRAFQAGESKAQSGSPSRLFMKLGNSLSEGLALGIMSGADKVDAAVKNLVPTRIPGFADSGAVIDKTGWGGGDAPLMLRRTIDEDMARQLASAPRSRWDEIAGHSAFSGLDLAAISQAKQGRERGGPARASSEDLLSAILQALTSGLPVDVRNMDRVSRRVSSDQQSRAAMLSRVGV